MFFSQIPIELLAHWWCLGTLFILGACIGSFLNVVVYRIPAKISLLSPPSRCPKCETPIRSFDNVPILGWFLLRGRCRACSVWIPLRYPFVELLTAVLFAYVGWTRGNPVTSVASAVAGQQGNATVEYDLVGQLADDLRENGWAILVSLIAASLLVVASFWFIDRVKMPHWFTAMSVVVTGAAVGLSHDPPGSLLFVVLGSIAFLPYGVVRRKWNRGVPWQNLPWQNLVVAGALGAVLIAVR